MTIEVSEQQKVEETLLQFADIIETQESKITELVLRIDDLGWDKLQEVDKDTGIRIDALKKMTKGHYDVVAANPLIGRATRVRGAFVWGQGLEIIPEAKNTQMKTVLKSIRRNSNVFLRSQQLELEQTATASGNVFLRVRGRGKSGSIRVVPIEQISGAIYEPDPVDGVRYYIRKWTVTVNGEDSEKIAAYRASSSAPTAKRVKFDGKSIEVADDFIVHIKFNSPNEWTWGLPELFGTHFWASSYKKSMESDLSVKEALARFVWKVQAANGSATRKAASQVAGTPGSGGTAGMSDGQNMMAINKSGANVSFNDNWPLAAIVAAGFDVPLAELLYQQGSTDPNTLSETNAHVLSMRQEVWCEALERCFDLMGVPVNVIMPHLFSEPVHRVAQAISVLGATNLLHAEELREAAQLQLKRYGVETFKDGLPEPGAWADFTQGEAENPGTPPLNTPDDSDDDARSPSGALADGDNEIRDKDL